MKFKSNQNTKLFIPEKSTKNVVCEMRASLSKGRWVKPISNWKCMVVQSYVNQHCSCWCPCSKAPDHQYPLYWPSQWLLEMVTECMDMCGIQNPIWGKIHPAIQVLTIQHMLCTNMLTPCWSISCMGPFYWGSWIKSALGLAHGYEIPST